MVWRMLGKGVRCGYRPWYAISWCLGVGAVAVVPEEVDEGLMVVMTARRMSMTRIPDWSCDARGVAGVWHCDMGQP